MIKVLNLDNNQVKLVVWDIAGQSRFSKLRKFYYKGSQGAFAVFDLTNPDTFLKLSEWVASFRKTVGEDVPMVLIGNKMDLDRKVDRKDAENLAKELGCIYFETSAKLNQNVDHVFDQLSIKILNNMK